MEWTSPARTSQTIECDNVCDDGQYILDLKLVRDLQAGIRPQWSARQSARICQVL
jgi:hypothetical protein